MTRISIDPDELYTASAALQRGATELADIGAALPSCSSVPMPPAVAADVTALMSSLDALLDRIAVNYIALAVGLSQRGLIAALDTQAAAAGTNRDSLARSLGIDLAALGIAPAVPLTPPAGPAGSGAVGKPGATKQQSERAVTEAMVNSQLAKVGGQPSLVDVMFDAADGGMSHLLAPSRTDIENKFARGNPMTDSEVGRISPDTLTRSQKRGIGL